ncbi:MAG TPA: hydrogenase maturation nickel metallochaperone HypA [Terriglobales bacterium]|nr:hydrogenase maturation nickel metallochaperone HypA [Terriglobales bacterium]
MHELGIASSVLQEAREEAQRHPGARLRKVRVRVGELSGVNPDALRFCFEVLVRDAKLEPLELEIETCARQQRCPACDLTFTVAGYDLSCPTCGTAETQFVSGDELELASLEMEDYEPSAIAAQSS